MSSKCCIEYRSRVFGFLEERKPVCEIDVDEGLVPVCARPHGRICVTNEGVVTDQSLFVTIVSR